MIILIPTADRRFVIVKVARFLNPYAPPDIPAHATEVGPISFYAPLASLSTTVTAHPFSTPDHSADSAMHDGS